MGDGRSSSNLNGLAKNPGILVPRYPPHLEVLALDVPPINARRDSGASDFQPPDGRVVDPLGKYPHRRRSTVGNYSRF